MIAFLVLALFSGMTCAIASAVLGAGILTVLLWYGAGCWIGFFLVLGAMLVLRWGRPHEPDLQTSPAMPAD